MMRAKHRQLKVWGTFVLIVIFAQLIRGYELGNIPFGLFRDEAEKGYNAWTIATEGVSVDFSAKPGPANITLHHFPFMIDVMGGSISAIYHYASVPFIWANGLSISATRSAAALIGTLTVALLGILMMNAFGWRIGLFSALLAACSPWLFTLSRWAHEGIFVPFFLTMALLGIWGIARGRGWGWSVFGFGFGWLFYCYSAAQLFSSVWILTLLLLFRKDVLYWIRAHPVWAISGVVLALIPVIPTLWIRLSPDGATRLTRIAVWNDLSLTALGVIWAIIKNYFAHFNPKFLFFSGDSLPRHAIPGMGQLFPQDIIFLIIFLLFLRRTVKIPRCQYSQSAYARAVLLKAMFSALICGPMPAAITQTGIPHALRAFAMAIPLCAFSAIGIGILQDFQYKLPGSLLKKRLLCIIISLYLISTAVMLTWYTLYFRAGCSFSSASTKCFTWNNVGLVAFEAGERISWEKIRAQHSLGERVWIDARLPYIHYFHLFFMRVPPHQALEPQFGMSDFIYFYPQAYIPIKKGDWIFKAFLPDQLSSENNPFLTPEETRRVGEVWVKVEQIQ